MRISSLASFIHSMPMGRMWNRQLQLLLLKYPTPIARMTTMAALRILPPFRHFSSTPIEAGVDDSKTSLPKATADVGSVVEMLQLRNKEDGEWNSEELQSLLSSAPFTPSHLLQVIRGLGDSKIGLRFFEWTRNQSLLLSSEQGEAIHGPSAYRALFELASREQPNPHLRMLELLQKSREQGFSLTTDSASLLIHCFGRAGLASECVQVFEEIKPPLRKTRLYNNLLDVLFKLECTDKALTLASGMLRPDSKCQPNHVTGSIIFSTLLKRIPRKVAEEVVVNLVLEMGKHKVFPDAFQFTQWVTRLCRSGNSSKAWDVLHAIEKMGGPVETPSFNALLTGLGRDKDFKRMNLLLAEMKDMCVQPNVVTFSILINHLCKSRQVDEALQVLDKMTRGGEPQTNSATALPDIITFNTIIDGLCKVGRQEEGLALVDRMRTEYGCSPNTVTYNCLIDGFCKAGAIEKSQELFSQMMEDGVPLNVVTLNTIVNGMCKHGRISTALEFFSDMCSKGLKGNAVTYSTLIDAFLHANNVNKAVELFEEMVRGGLSPDSITYFILISGLSQAGRPEEACSIASSMQEAGFHLDVISYNNLISGLCRKNKLDKAHEMLEEMERAGIKPDVATFNTLIAALSKGGHFLTAHQVMGKMVEDGCKPSVVTYGALIHGYCKASNLNEALKIFRAMGAAGVQPNAVIYTMLIDFLCKAGELDAALLLMDEMRVGGVPPSAATYNAMFKGLRDQNLLEKAFELMDQMTEQCCNPDYITMEILTEWLSAVGEMSRLRQFVHGSVVSV
ncbi:pentatricopeptide repeat-containing protein At3g61520, mitochondrial-like [Magnolia sinica]|uniref:pentatricopeptide repeat-containing protein At3g61520, mitochondrial-like n=1 Tax=Magnolia sinica TaxID=86752 RepID=UPI00265AEAB7|nr:pentatricopeptide repeat-containing protein At3g61520, mitochondrial-like [Magnolia sinica]XP_058102285.1 pentatricopeptide repeat-containing protein At3g61520, mitochondrial-like [Magnolia sinica]XP_058102286.1 pentatricopeptide repeat-containing protein At3g61520, mitochondrial-like [Magnolia sinica]